MPSVMNVKTGYTLCCCAPRTLTKRMVNRLFPTWNNVVSTPVEEFEPSPNMSIEVSGESGAQRKANPHGVSISKNGTVEAIPPSSVERLCRFGVCCKNMLPSNFMCEALIKFSFSSNTVPLDSSPIHIPSAKVKLSSVR